MQYRPFGRTGQRVSALGFGAMRLPTRGDEADVDEPAAAEMIRWAVDHGVNYVDTAYPYHGGQSEVVVGRALAGGYREKVHLATKSPVWKIEKRSDLDRFLDEQLTRLGTDHVDFYLLHCLREQHWPRVRDLGVLDWSEKARADGRIGHFGFSFHDRFEVFTRIVDAYDWDLCQIQYNYVNEDVQAGTRGLRYAAERGLAVVVMEPLFGGTLAAPPPAVGRIWDGSHSGPVELALRWLWDKPEVSLVLSGMSTLEQVRQNVATAGRSGPGTLTEEERRLIARVRDKYTELSPIPCTKCGYCSPCPNGVDIPRNFELANTAGVFGGSTATLCRNLYNGLTDAERAAACERCGACGDHCPQGIDIPKLLAHVAERFG